MGDHSRFNCKSISPTYHSLLTYQNAFQPFTNDFPHADIHELLSGDILHQLIKGCFKDYLVTWISKYLIKEHEDAEEKKYLDEVDRR